VIHTRHLTLCILPLLAAAAGLFSAACTDANPAGPSQPGATINGSLVANRVMSGVTVTVSGTNVGTTVGASQRFTLREVPAGDVRLLFKGPAVSGAVDLKGVRSSEAIEVVVHVIGSTVALTSEERNGDADDDDGDDGDGAEGGGTGGGGGGSGDRGSCPPAGANRNLDLVGSCTINGHLNGNIKISNGTLTVGASGSVDGNIEQFGTGGVTVLPGGFVNGNIKEIGDGSVMVSGGMNGKIEEEGEGGIEISGSGHVRGDVIEKGAGDVVVNGRVDGNVEESEAGSVLGSGVVDGNVKESGPGGIDSGLTVKGKREATS
jgi:cytoskeletal protein CcmA (bactofilin family)